jgi:Rrf2 family protein
MVEILDRYVTDNNKKSRTRLPPFRTATTVDERMQGCVGIAMPTLTEPFMGHSRPKQFEILLALSDSVTIIVTIVAVNLQFSIAVHLMAGLGFRNGKDTASRELASSVNTSPSFVRRTLSKLSKAGLVRTATGKAGACWLAKEPKQISLLDIYRAVDAPKAFAIHSYATQKACPVSCNIKKALEHALGKTQNAMETALEDISLAQILADMKR